MPPQRRRPLAHPRDAVACVDGASYPVVGNLNGHPVVVGEPDSDRVGMGVAGDVGEGLLHDPVRGELDCSR